MVQAHKLLGCYNSAHAIKLSTLTMSKRKPREDLDSLVMMQNLTAFNFTFGQNHAL